MIQFDNLSVIGKFRRTHALKGELNAELEIDDEYFSESPWIFLDMDSIPTPFRIETIRPKGAQTSLIKLFGIDSEEDAKKLVNKEIKVDATTLKNYLGEDQDGMYATDFIGYALYNVDGAYIGTINDINLNSEENPLFNVINTENKEFLIPVADDLIISYNTNEKKIEMQLPDGILQL